jgi:hypothetical protein
MHNETAPAQSRNVSRVASLAAVGTLLVFSWSDGRACGFHDDVSIARGVLNWTYPEALHVIGAISAEVAQKRLLHREVELAAPGLFSAQYHATVKTLERLSGLLREAGGGSPSFSLVLVEPMLWTRFEVGTSELRTQLHAAGPQAGDLVLISGQNVIRAVADGELAIGDARDRGLIRLYGNETQIARFLDVFKNVGREHRVGSRDQARGARDLSSRPTTTQ